MNRIVLDVETANGLDDPLVYDLGFIVFNDEGTIEEHSWVIDDVFYHMADKMKTAYYANKLPRYRREIRKGLREVVTMREAYKRFAAICDKYDVKEVWAYNCSFDVNALNNTMSTLSNGWCDRFIPATIKTKCIMGAAMSTICNTKRFADFAERTEKGNIRVTAEEVYRYISGDTDFDEDHTGLEDCKIELQILIRCMKYRRKMETDPKQVFNFQVWRDLQAKYPAA